MATGLVLRAGAPLARAGGWLAKTVSSWFRKEPTVMAAFASRIPYFKGKAINIKSVSNYVRENPLTALTTLALIPEAVSLVDQLRSDNPDVARVIDAMDADDTIESLGMDRAEIAERRSTARQARQEKIDDLPLSAVMNFADEANLIDTVINTMPGRSFEQRMAQFYELRRAINMPDSNFELYERIRSLRGE